MEDLLQQAAGGSPMSQADRRLCQELVYGAVRWERTLDWLIARRTQNRVQKRPLQNLLRLGLYQIFWLERIPDHAAVHQTVELARQFGFGPQAGFVNALLRGYLREAEATRNALEELKAADPAVGYSHPSWLVERWLSRWGSESTTRLMAWNNTPPKTFARVNTLKTEPGRLLEKWREENVDYDFVRRDWLEEGLAFELKSHPPLQRLESFRLGHFYLQDPGTLLAVRELDPKPGEAVLDLCAAPGGKLTFIAQLMRNEGRVLAYDTSAERLKLVRENCGRMGVQCVETLDPRPPDAESRSFGLFDRVLLDAPCSNTGVMRRRVELRWRIWPEEIERLHRLQSGLLRQAADNVRPGGLLVYSTCSLEPEENQAVVEEFLKAHPEFESDRVRQLTPIGDEVDGAFVARLRRRAGA